MIRQKKIEKWVGTFRVQMYNRNVPNQYLIPMFQENVPRIHRMLYPKYIGNEFDITTLNEMKFSTLIEAVAAVHLAPRVTGNVSNERGGLMIVAPPGGLKTTAIEYLDAFPKTKLITNITVRTINGFRQDFLADEVVTMGFADYDMIYRRHGSVSSQIEGSLMSLMAEGFRNPAFSDQRVNVTKARCTIIAGITVRCFENMIAEWIDSGFARRFLWCRYILKNSELLELALCEWKRHNLEGDFIMKVPGQFIPHCITKEQATKMLYQLRFQFDRKLPFITAQRMVSVWIWKHGQKEGWKLWEDFAPSLSKEGCMIEL